MTSLQVLILVFSLPNFCETDFRSTVCSRDSRFSICPASNDAPTKNNTSKLAPANGSTSAIDQFCSQYKTDYANCAKSPPPDFAKSFCTYYHDSCPGAAPLAVSKIQDVPLLNVSSSTPLPNGSWVNPFLARPGGIVNNPQLIGVDTRGGNLPPNNAPIQPPPQPPPPEVPAAAQAPIAPSSPSGQPNAGGATIGSSSNAQAGPVNVGSSSSVGLGGLSNLITGATGG